MKVVFFSQAPVEESERDALKAEASEFNDLVVEMVKNEKVEMQHFYNNTALIEMKWLANFCPNALLSMHSYDIWDVDVEGVLSLFKQKFDRRRPDLNLVACDRIARTDVKRHGKFKVPIEIYGNEQFPDGCQESCYFMGRKAFRLMYETSKKVEYMPFMESMWVTGVLRSRSRIQTPHRIGAAGSDFCHFPGGETIYLVKKGVAIAGGHIDGE